VEKIYKLILENILTGKISKDEAGEMIRALKQKREKTHDIAVIGLSVNLPLAKNTQEFWNVIKNKVDCIRRIPEERKKDLDDLLAYLKYDVTKMRYEQMGYLDDISNFDYDFFNIAPKEAALMDPNQRLFLQTAWNAIEDAGYGGDKLKGTKTGVYIGFGNKPQYQNVVSTIDPESAPITFIGNCPPIMAGRLAYILDLKGPSILIDTACSSSLVAVYYACQAIRIAECDMAIVGSVNTTVFPVQSNQKIGIESESSRIKAFDVGADGTVGGEGVIAVILKSLNKALEDRDAILAIIKGIAINQDGKSNGLTSPNPLAQAEVIKMAWEDAKINPESIAYIEAHGTGTKLGDPIEIDGLQKAFKAYTDKKEICAISSVKTNIGHLDHAAGIAGLVTALLALKNREIPPLRYFESPNEAINLDDSPIYLNNQLKKWANDESPRRCGVSSFGLSGTNCHVVLEEATDIEEDLASFHLNLLTISAKTKESLFELIQKYNEYFEEISQKDINNVCYTSNTGRGHYNYRVAIIFDCRQLLKEKLERCISTDLEDNLIPDVFYGEHRIVDLSMISESNYGIDENEKRSYSKMALDKMDAFIKNEKNNKQILAAIGELYTRGADIEWEYLYKDEKNKRVHIPTYPFRKKRCWLKVPTYQNNNVSDDNLYYSLLWKEKALENKANVQLDKNILMLVNETRNFDDLIEFLKAESKRLIVVRKGEKFEKLDENNYFTTGTQEDFDILFDEISDCEIELIIHLCSAAGPFEVKNYEELQESQSNGVFNLLFLIKSTIKQKREIEVVITAKLVNEVTGLERIICPENSILFGLGKIVNMEYPHIRCRMIDMDENFESDQLLAELKSSDDDYQVAYRNGVRYVDELNKVNLNEFKTDGFQVNSEGIYIISGGTGRLGLKAAKYLASKGKINIALVNRSVFPNKSRWADILGKSDDLYYSKVKAMRDIEESGSKVTCYSVDITNEKDLDIFLTEMRKQYGRINGIIHCAGVGVGSKGKLLSKESKETFKAVLLPKVEGTWLLDKLTSNDPMDFLILYSSLITLSGGRGAGSYVAANSYLDSYAALRNKRQRKTLVINWPVWEEDEGENENENENEKENEKEKLIFNEITTEKAISALDDVLNRNISRIIIGELNYSNNIVDKEGYLPFRLSDELKRLVLQKNQEFTMHNMVYDSALGTGEVITQLCQEVLGCDNIGPNDNLLDLGMDSFLGIQLISKLEKVFGERIKVGYLFMYPTVTKICEYIDKSFTSARKPNDDFEKFEF
jgi:acyl transferase domain-containing protein/acyl carrier protein